MLTQNDLERELYEGRLKVKRDQQTQENLRRMAVEQRELLAAQLDQWQQKYQQVNQEREAAVMREEQANREREAANREREAACQEAKLALAERIGLCQRLLRQPVFPADGLLGLSIEELRGQAERLERELTDRNGLE